MAGHRPAFPKIPQIRASLTGSALLFRRELLAPLNRSHDEGEIEAGKVADAGAVERVAVPPGIEANEVERNGGEDVLQVSLLETEVSGTSHPGDRDGLVDGSLDARAGSVLSSPLLVALLEAGMVEDLSQDH